MSAQEESAINTGLSDLEVRILDFEGNWWRYAGAKEAAIKELFDCLLYTSPSPRD